MRRKFIAAVTSGVLALTVMAALPTHAEAVSIWLDLTPGTESVETFQYKDYADRYSDAYELYGYDAEALFNHYETVGKAEYRRALVSNQSARLLCGYLYASAGHGESTQDMVFAGHDLIAENGTLLAETSPFEGGWAETELDCQRMESERARNTSFEPSAEGYLTVDFDLALTETKLSRWVDPTPFIPHDERRRAERCELILKMQADGLAKRLEHAHAKTAVIGISGGLDSCLALLVAVRAMKQLGRPTSDVLAVTMPCFGTTHRTRSNAEILCDELAVSFTEIGIANTVHHILDHVAVFIHTVVILVLILCGVNIIFVIACGSVRIVIQTVFRACVCTVCAIIFIVCIVISAACDSTQR